MLKHTPPKLNANALLTRVFLNALALPQSNLTNAQSEPLNQQLQRRLFRAAIQGEALRQTNGLVLRSLCLQKGRETNALPCPVRGASL